MNKLVWLRNDLRWHDHSPFYHAFQDANSDEQVYALYLISEAQWDAHEVAECRRYLVYQTLEALQQILRDQGVVLLIREAGTYASHQHHLQEVIERLDIDAVYANQDYPLNEFRRDAAIHEWLTDSPINMHWFEDTVLVPPGRVTKSDGDFYQVFTPFAKTWRSFVEQHPEHYQPLTMPEAKLLDEPAYQQARKEWRDIKRKRHFEAQVQLGYHEQEADILAQLEAFCEAQLQDYKSDRDIPSVEGTSRLSAYLSLGSLSARTAHYQAWKASQKHDHSEGWKTWQSELIWRDFYRHIMAQNPKLSMHHAFKDNYDQLPWRENHQQFLAWCQGQTGFPLVDAAMRQLNHTGWMHNRLRMLVAVFLTKYLLIDWHWGESYFMSRLIDGDFAANNGGWQWSSSVGTDAAPYFRVLSPLRQAERFDEQALFIKQYVPELKSVSAKDILKMRQLDKKADYPAPMIELKGRKDEAVAFFKAHL